MKTIDIIPARGGSKRLKRKKKDKARTFKEINEEFERIKVYVDKQIKEITSDISIYIDPITGNKYSISFEISKSQLTKI